MQRVILLFVIYRNLERLVPWGVNEYLKMIFVYCGGELGAYKSITSFYLLEKKNLFNPFRYSISEGETEWMLLSLYEMSIEKSEADGFGVLAAVNMVCKKTANEAMFR